MKPTTIPSVPGTYALLLACRNTGTVGIGRLGTLRLQSGCYVYVGSAFGPGGLAARIKHHRRITTCPHWHMDYLRAVCDLVEIWFTPARGRHEHSWARIMALMPDAEVPMRGFGSSDCDCRTHLFWFAHSPSVGTFRRRVKSEVNVHR